MFAIRDIKIILTFASMISDSPFNSGVKYLLIRKRFPAAASYSAPAVKISSNLPMWLQHNNSVNLLAMSIIL